MSVYMHAAAAACLALMLTGCGKPSEAEIQDKARKLTEAARAEYRVMDEAQLPAESARLVSECAKPISDPKATPDSVPPCERIELVSEVLKDKGFCWGPYAAVKPDKSWMKCSDDVTQKALERARWFSKTRAGQCSQVGVSDAVSQILGKRDPWNIKTAFTRQGFLMLGSQNTTGQWEVATLYPDCATALMVYLESSASTTGDSIAVPLGFSVFDAGEYFGFDPRTACSSYSFGGRGMGCGMALQEGGPTPIKWGDGSTPCTPGKPIQLDFLPRGGMVGITCSVSEDKRVAFEQQMSAEFGASEKRPDGSLRWEFGKYKIRSMQAEIYGNKVHRISVFQE